jgi:hypothetical protein
MPFERHVLRIDILRRTFTTLRIIVLALFMGVVVFAGVAVSQNLGKPQVLATKLDPFNTALLGCGLLALVLGFVVPRFLPATSISALSTPPPGLTPEQLKAATPELLRIDAILQRVQTSTIIGCAFFEGGAFANVFGYMQSRELLHLVLAGVLIVAILIHIPTETGLERRIEEELRRQKDSDSFGTPS